MRLVLQAAESADRFAICQGCRDARARRHTCRKSAAALEIARGAVHPGDNSQSRNNSESADDLMGAEINGGHRGCVQHDTNQNRMIEE
jgi:hypothetical protein